MSKAERLFALVTMLRGRRTAVTALDLARALDVSERTIYRDIAALAESGIPLEGETGVGYRLAAHAHLPPLMFDPEEAIAIAVGLRLVRAAQHSLLAGPSCGLSGDLAWLLPFGPVIAPPPGPHCGPGRRPLPLARAARQVAGAPAPTSTRAAVPPKVSSALSRALRFSRFNKSSCNSSTGKP